jgi:uncharacterized protein YaaR (DUF327 family)
MKNNYTVEDVENMTDEQLKKAGEEYFSATQWENKKAYEVAVDRFVNSFLKKSN